MGEDARSVLAVDIACCADLYQLPIVRMLLGDSWHPGGLALTRALAKELKLTGRGHLLDVACGQGASAIMMAQVYKCRVSGVDADPRSLEVARKDSFRYRLNGLVSFIQGDAKVFPFPTSCFDAVLIECATSLISDRRDAFSEMTRVLCPGGRLALSDVTFSPDALPAPLDLPLARALCIPVSTGPEEYQRLIEGVGLTVLDAIDWSPTIVQILDKAESLVGVLPLSPSMSQQAGNELKQTATALKCVRQLVEEGKLGYWAFIAEKPG